uniref:RNase H type-1 domain-containing protein n=1 Tax=Cannabis sativa TaxID=3483 RepID=A0A803PAM3_CANSA
MAPTCRSAADVVLKAHIVLDQWKHAQARKFESLLVPSRTVQCEKRWTKPANNMIKINVSGAIFAAEKAFGYGILVQDHHGGDLEAFAMFLASFVQLEAAKIIGIKESLSWMKGKTWSNVVVETNCFVVIQALQSAVCMPSTFSLFVLDYKKLSSSLLNVHVCFAK